MKKTTPKRPAKAAQASRAASKTARVTTKDKKSTSKLTTSTLRLFNILASLLLAAQAIALVLLSNKEKGDVPVTANFLTRDPVASDAAGQTVLAQAADHLVSVNLVYLAAAVLLLAALANLLQATRYRTAYETELKAGNNKFRWLGYIFSLGLLLLTGALLVGVSDIAALFMLFALTVVACVTAINVEAQRFTGGSKWLSRLAILAGLAPLLVLGLYVFFSHVYGGGLPFEYLIVAGILGLGLLISALALSNVYRMNAKAGQYLAVERTYLVFNFLVLTIFSWTLFSLLLK